MFCLASPLCYCLSKLYLLPLKREGTVGHCYCQGLLAMSCNLATCYGPHDGPMPVLRYPLELQFEDRPI